MATAGGSRRRRPSSSSVNGMISPPTAIASPMASDPGPAAPRWPAARPSGTVISAATGMASASPSTRRVRRPTLRPVQATAIQAISAATANSMPGMDPGRPVPPSVVTPAAASRTQTTSRRRRDPASAITSGPAKESVTATPIGIMLIAWKKVRLSAASEAP